MQVANELGIIEGETCRWDEALTKGEMMNLLIETYEAENNEYGYLLNAEYGEGQEFNTEAQKQDNESKVGDEIQNGGLSDTAGNGGAGETDLKAIFDPYLCVDFDTKEIKPTADMYQILGAFGISEDTHDVDAIFNDVMYDVLVNNNTITSDDIAKALEDYGETYKKESQPEANPAGQTENQGQGQTGGGTQSQEQQPQQPAQPQQPDVQPQQPAQPQAPAEAQPSGGDEQLPPEIQAMFDSTPGGDAFKDAPAPSGGFNAN